MRQASGFRPTASRPPAARPGSSRRRSRRRSRSGARSCARRAYGPNELGAPRDSNVERRARQRDLSARPPPVGRRSSRETDGGNGCRVHPAVPEARDAPARCRLRARFHHFRLCAARGAGRDDRHRPFGGRDRDGKVVRRRDDGAKPELRSRQHLRAALRRRNVRRRFCASGTAASASPGRRAPADAGAARPGRGARRARPRLGQHDLLPRERSDAPVPRAPFRLGQAQRRGAERGPPSTPVVPGGGLRRNARHDLDRIRRRRARNARAGGDVRRAHPAVQPCRQSIGAWHCDSLGPRRYRRRLARVGPRPGRLFLLFAHRSGGVETIDAPLANTDLPIASRATPSCSRRVGGKMMRSVMKMGAIVLCCAPMLVFAQSSRPVRVIVPYAPGGNVDTIARLYAQQLGENLGEKWIVENVSGGNGVIGTAVVARSAPDGMTLLFSGDVHNLARLVMKNVPYDPVADFTPISQVARAPLLVVVNPSLVRAANLTELVTEIRADPKKYAFAISGLGSSLHIGAEMFRVRSGADILTVPYRSAGPAVADLVGGQVSMMVVAPLAVIGFVKTGKL